MSVLNCIFDGTKSAVYISLVDLNFEMAVIICDNDVTQIKGQSTIRRIFLKTAKFRHLLKSMTWKVLTASSVMNLYQMWIPNLEVESSNPGRLNTTTSATQLSR